VIGFAALVLAGSRGPEDPVARAEGVDHKVFVEIAGKPMIDYVLAAAGAAQSVVRTAVVSNIGDLLAARLPEGVRHVEGGDGPSESVRRGVESLEGAYPVLVLTADNPLLTAERIDRFCAASAESGADVTAGLTPSAVVLERFPDAERTFLKFKDERYSGTNLFAIMNEKGLKAVDFWQTVEADRKNPTKLAGHFGVTTAALFLAGALTLEEGVARLSKKVGLAAKAIPIRDPLAPVDVDKPEDLALVRRLMQDA
jgi:CTP:molybdopterin cytidylyltransferase MocA